jgi:hypothetical protein
MASSTKNVKLGVCKIFYGGLDLGLTKGGVEVSVSTETYKVEVDQFGKTIINNLVMGRNVEVKVPLAETTVRNLVETMPGSTLVTDGAQATGTLTFASNPTAATTITVGGQAFTFQVAKPTTAFQIMLGATALATLTNAVDVINRSMVQAALGGVRATLNALATVITITAGDPGTAQNAFTLAGASGAVASGATLTGGVAETKARVDVATGVGIDLLNNSKLLRLHPTTKADNDFSDDFVVYLAGTGGALTFAYKLDQERVYNVDFMGYPDASGKLFSVGDLLA